MTHFLSYLFQSALKMQLILRGGQTFTSKCFGMKSYATVLPTDLGKAGANRRCGI